MSLVAAVRYADLTPAEQEAASAELARAECAAQGLPFTVEDPAVLAKVARVAAGASRAAGSCPEPAVVSGVPGVSSGEGEAVPTRVGSPTVEPSPVQHQRRSA